MYKHLLAIHLIILCLLEKNKLKINFIRFIFYIEKKINNRLDNTFYGGL